MGRAKRRRHGGSPRSGSRVGARASARVHRRRSCRFLANESRPSTGGRCATPANSPTARHSRKRTPRPVSRGDRSAFPTPSDPHRRLLNSPERHALDSVGDLYSNSTTRNGMHPFSHERVVTPMTPWTNRTRQDAGRDGSGPNRDEAGRNSTDRDQLPPRLHRCSPWRALRVRLPPPSMRGRRHASRPGGSAGVRGASVGLLEVDPPRSPRSRFTRRASHQPAVPWGADAPRVECTWMLLIARASAGAPEGRPPDSPAVPRPSARLRHALLAQGVPARVVMETLGHSTIAVTMNVYSHVMPELQREAADRMGAFLTGSDS